jgi:HAD superfamily hydrolase (TIGR01509 family)
MRSRGQFKAHRTSRDTTMRVATTTTTRTTACRASVARTDGLRARRVGAKKMRTTTTPMALRNFDYPEALLFDCDGVLCETERDGHRVTFNATFKEFGIDHEWDVETYGELLKIGGGKERMTHFFDSAPETEPWKSVTDPEERKALVKKLHLRKTEMFLELVNAGALPLRPGVKRMVSEALEAGAKVAVCSTSNEKAVQGIVNTMLPEFADRMPVFAGDVVAKKKPSPDIYNLAAETLKVNPARCVVVEDTHIGCTAAKAAGMRCCVTKSIYSEGEDFSRADAVFDCLGDEGDERVKFHDLTTPGAFW